MDAHLRAGVAIYNAGGYHPAHDAWEDHWLDLESGTPDERFLHGLIQFTAAIYHAHNGNWDGLLGLAESSLAYLDDLPATYRAIDLEPIRTYLAALAADPEHVERVDPPKIEYSGRPITPEDLDFEGAAIVAEVLAEERADVDEAVIDTAIDYAREAIDSGGSDEFVALVFDFATSENHALVYQRLSEHVARRRDREADVDGLFE